MKINLDKDLLISTITPMTGCVSNKNTIPATAGILIKTDNDACILSAYDLEKGMRTRIAASVQEEGAFILNATKLLQIIRTMPGPSVSIEVNPKNNQTVISSGSASFEIAALPGEEFPDLPYLQGDESFKIRQCDLKDMIAKTSFAVAQNDPRPSLNGAFFRIRNNVITVVGCDGNRLALFERTCELEVTTGSSLPDMEFIVPGKTLSEILRLLGDTEDTIELQLTRRHLILVHGDLILFSRLIDQQYVEYERFIPKQNKIHVRLSCSSLISSLERAMLVTEDKQQGQVKSPVKCIFSGNTLTVTSVSVVSRVNDVISCEKEGEDIEIGFNCRLLLDALRTCDTDDILLSLSSPLMSMLIEPAEPAENCRFLLLALPVRLGK